MAAITITFNVDNSAFRNLDEKYNNDGSLNYGEVSNVLKEIANKVDQGYDEGNVNDANGNTVGSWSIA